MLNSQGQEEGVTEVSRDKMGDADHRPIHEHAGIALVGELVDTAEAVAQRDQELRARVDAALSNQLAPSTRATYEHAWTDFVQFCCDYPHQEKPLPAKIDVACDYLLRMGDAISDDGSHCYSVSTINVACSAIKYMHRNYHDATDADAVGVWNSPRLPATMSAIRKERARLEAQKTIHRATANGPAARKKNTRRAPLLKEQVDAAVEAQRLAADTWRRRVQERRDSLIMLIGWTGALRRSEIVHLDVGSIDHSERDWTLRVDYSKADQEGLGLVKALPQGRTPATCARCAYVRWLECIEAHDRLGRAGLIRTTMIGAGAGPDFPHICQRRLPRVDPHSPLLRKFTTSGTLIDERPDAVIVHQAVRRSIAGIDTPRPASEYGAHSLRAGFVTQAFRNGHTAERIMRQTGHKTVSSLLAYYREYDSYRDNPAVDMA